MQILYSYNFNAEEVLDENFAALFNQRRRDSTFAFAYKKQDDVYALRDHLGIAPLYYRFDQNSVRFSPNLTDLIETGDEFNEEGVLAYLKFGTPRLIPLIKGIEIVPPGSVLKLNPISQEKQVVFSYQFRPRHIPLLASLHQLVDELDPIFNQAIERLVEHDTVGLYLSGGIDSALIGIYLRKMGVNVNAYTSGAWGHSSSEIPFAKTNAQIAQVNRHTVDYLETDAYQQLMEDVPRLFGLPHGTSTALGVASLWKNTDISKEKQLFLGQNSDTMLCGVSAQYISYFLRFLPPMMRRKVHPRFRFSSLTANYLSFARGITDDPAQFHLPLMSNKVSAIQKLILYGMFIVHTPSDSEVLTQPAINRNIKTSNPYYDLDLIEFVMGLPLRHRIAIMRSSKLGVSLDKRILKRLASRYLPASTVNRKKGFTVSFERDERTQRLTQTWPDKIMGSSVERVEERFAAQILMNWQTSTGLQNTERVK